METSRGLVQPLFRLLGDIPGRLASSAQFLSSHKNTGEVLITYNSPLIQALPSETMIIPVSSDKGLCGGINSTVVKFSKVVSHSSEERDFANSRRGKGSRAAFSKSYSHLLKT